MKKWSKKEEMMYEELCLSDDYDEEACYNFVIAHSDEEFDEEGAEEE
jgi:hypothetical protein